MSNNWTNGNNWVSGTAPVANDALFFAGSTRLTNNDNNFAAGTQFNGITFNAGAGAFTLKGNAIHLGGDVTNNSTNTQTIDPDLVLTGANRTFNAASGDLAVSGVVSGSYALVKSGSHALTLSGSNTYSGGTTLSAGSLIGTTSSLQGNIVTSAGTLVTFDQATAGTYAGNLSGSGSLMKTGAGALTFSGSNTYSGGTTLSAGSLVGTTSSLQGNIATSAGTGVTFDQATAGTYAGNLFGAGSLTKSGAGALTLTGSNTYSGGTTLSAGTLALGSANAIGSSGTISFGGGTLQFSASNTTDYSSRFSSSSGQVYNLDTNGQNVTLASALTSSDGSLTKTGAGILNLTNTAAVDNTVLLNLTTNVVAGDLEAVSGNAELRIGSSGTGILNVSGGRVADTTGYLGLTIGSVGTATVSSGTWANSGDLFLGSYGGDGTLNVTGGSVSNSNGYLGYEEDGVGTATVSSGTWANSGDLVLGLYGSYGTLNVTGGSVTDTTGVMGAYGSGTATVSSGTWANSGDLVVGDSYGHGTLNVTGGSVSNSNGYLGGNGVGTATVSSGTWANSGDLVVGNVGDGTLNVTGGSVSNSHGYLGYSEYGVGTATVSSGTWANGILTVGEHGTGTLNVTGGRVTNSYGYLGAYENSVGTITVSSGTWASTDNIVVGEGGTGSLSVMGGSVTNRDAFVGYNPSGIGSATVSSGTWASSGNLVVGLGSSGTGTLTMSGGLVSVGGTLSRGTHGTINLNAGGTLQIGTGGTTGVLDTDLTNNGTLVFNRSNASTYSHNLSGSGSLTKAGSGTLTLSGSNTYSGGTTLSAGSLVGTTSSLQGNIATSAGTAVTFNQATAGTYAGNLSGAGSLTKSGAGALTLSGSNAYSGGTTLSAGSLVGTTSSLQGAIVTSAGTVVTFNQATAGTYAGNLSGSGSLTKLGSGELTVSSANSYTGLTWVREGTLASGTANAFAAASSLTVDSGATFDRAGHSQTLADVDVIGTVGNTGGGGLLTVTGLLNGTGSIVGDVLTTGSFQGSQSITGDVEVRGVHAPGNSAGIQSISGNLSYTSGGSGPSVAWELFANTDSNVGTTSFDQILVGGNLSYATATSFSLAFNGLGSTVDWSDAFWATNEQWVVWSVTGSTTGIGNLSLTGTDWLDANGQSLSTSRAGSSFSLGLGANGKDVVLSYLNSAPVPEIDPAGIGSVLALVTGVFALLERRRVKLNVAVVPPLARRR